MKELKNSTRKNYSLLKLVNHAERFLSYHYSEVSPYRFSMNGRSVIVFEYCESSRSYWHDGEYDKEDFNNMIIDSIYRNTRRQYDEVKTQET
jgi:hypothetical protein